MGGVDDVSLCIPKALYIRVELKMMEENEKIRCDLDDETNFISETSHVNANLLSHPCEEVVVEEVQKQDTMLGTIIDHEIGFL